jgi:hypothetical protein
VHLRDRNADDPISIENVRWLRESKPHRTRPLPEVKRTWRLHREMSAYDAKRTLDGGTDVRTSARPKAEMEWPALLQFSARDVMLLKCSMP